MAKSESVEEQTQAAMEKAGEAITEHKKAVRAAVRAPQEAVEHEAEAVSITAELGRRAPHLIFLGAAFGSIIGSLVLYGMKRKDDAAFVGLWPPTFLALGLYADLIGLIRKSERSA